MLALNTIHEGDCLESLKYADDDSIDLCLFSPPYDQVRDYNGFAFDIFALGKELYRATKPGGVCVCVINDGTKEFAKSLTTFRTAVDWVDNAGWKLFETCIYSRWGRPGGWWNQRFRVDHEYILIFFKGDRPKHFSKKHMMVPTKNPNTVWHGSDRRTDGTLRKVENAPVNPTKCRGTVWKYLASNSEGNKLKLKHPATYPDQLASDLIQCFTQANDVVLDPTCGSGTTAVMAKRLGRQFIGIDYSHEYCEIARERLVRECQGDIFND